MTKRQAMAEAQVLADSEGRSFVVLGARGRLSVHRLSDLDFASVSIRRAVVVAPTGKYPLASAMDIVNAEARR